LEETGKSVLWLELLSESGHVPMGKLDDILVEAKTILSVLSKAEKPLATNRKNSVSEGKKATATLYN
jgi:hypothetical protein